LNAAFGESANGLGQETVFLLADTSVQCLCIVRVLDGDRLLNEDRAAIQVVGDEVDGAASDFDAMRQGVGDGVHRAAEGGQQRRVGIDDAAGIGLDEGRGEDLVEAGQDDQVDPGGIERILQQPLTRRASWLGGPVSQTDAHASGFGAPDRGRIGTVAADAHDPRRIVRPARGIEQRLQVRPFAGDQDADAERQEGRPLVMMRSG
jgi:hypothetical protein